MAAQVAVADWRAIEPADAQLALLAAQVDIAVGKHARAEATLLDTLARTPRNVDAAQALAQLYLARGDNVGALRYFQQVVEQRPRSVQILTIVGLLKEEAGDGAGARAAYQGALAVDSRAGVAANNLAWLTAADGNLPEALRLAVVAELALQGAPQAVDTLGWMYYLSGRYDEALHFLKIARDKTPTNATYHYHWGAASLRAGNKTEARRALARALQLSKTFPGESDARLMLDSIVLEKS
jgi:Flp pilus assembly protein TadD